MCTEVLCPGISCVGYTLPMTPGACWAYVMSAIPRNRTHASAPNAAIVKRRRLKLKALPPAVAEYGLKGSPTQGHRPVPAQPLVDERHDFIERVRLQPLLLRDAPDEAVYTLDMLSAAKERPRRRRGFAETLRGLRVLFKRHQIFVLRAEPVTQLRNPFIDRARLRRIAVHGLFDWNHLLAPDAAVIARDEHRPLRQRHEHRLVHLELHSDFERTIARVVASRLDVAFEIAQDGRFTFAVEARSLEVGRQSDLENVLRLVRWSKRLGVRARERDLRRIEVLPDARVCIAG